METSVNNKCRAFTSLEQSRKLSEILPLESADMQWFLEEDYGIVQIKEELQDWGGDCTIPCWSLAALLGVLPIITKGKENANPFIAKTPDNEYYVVYATLTKEVDSSAIYDNPIDACYDMILKLHESNLL